MVKYSKNKFIIPGMARVITVKGKEDITLLLWALSKRLSNSVMCLQDLWYFFGWLNNITFHHENFETFIYADS